jgi:drug/metabolite transporter (DMT)-like permease
VEGLDLSQEATAEPKQALSFGGKFQAPTNAIKQRYPESGFERIDLSGSSRLAQIDLSDRPMDAALIDDRHEGPQLIDVYLHKCKSCIEYNIINALDLSTDDRVFLLPAPFYEGSVANNPLAVLLGLCSAFAFGAAFVLTQFALRWMLPRLGAAFSVPTSTVLFWCSAPFLIDPAEVDLKAAGLFACVGLLFPAAVTLLNFESNRLMGPNIAGAVGGLSPVFAVLLALLLLEEHLRILQIFSIAAIVAGVVLMYRGQWQAFGSTGPWLLVLPLGASAIRGFVQPLIKVGLERWHNPIAAVVISYTVSSMVLILAALAPRQTLEQRFDRRGALWFAAVGLCNGSAVLSMYAALGHGPVIVVSPLVATYPLVTMILSSAFLERERVDAPLITAVTVTVVGAVLLLIA